MMDKKGATTAANYKWETEHLELRIYVCQYCRAWHLTSSVSWKKRGYHRK